MQNSWLSIILSSGPLLISLLVILLAGSMVVWAVIALKCRELYRLRKGSREFHSIFNRHTDLNEVRNASESLPMGGVIAMFHLSFQEYQDLASKQLSLSATSKQVREEVLTMLERVLESNLVQEEKRLGWGQSFLATMSVVAPFIGLLGTVIGIIDAFQSIAHLKSVELSVVAPGIAEALVATAAGLFAAIPATVAFNLFRSMIRDITESMEQFGLKLLNRWHLELMANHEKKA